jgi:hypothetical protein
LVSTTTVSFAFFPPLAVFCGASTNFSLPMKNLLIALLAISVLAAFSPKRQVFQVFTTSLRVTVLDDAGNVQEGATVTLYKTQQDLDKEQNPVGKPLTTDKRGVAIFRELEAQAYFVNAAKGDKDNTGGTVQTGALKANTLNKVNVIIE